MPRVSTAFAKNVIRRSFAEVIDPAPSSAEVAEIWQYFESKCAYCGKPLMQGAKEAHIDHLVSASLGGPNHISNRVLACAPCNEKEKRDEDWQSFLERKCATAEQLSQRTFRIVSWQVKHGRDRSEEEAQLLNVAAEAAARVTALFDEQANEVKRMKRQLLRATSSLPPRPSSDGRTKIRSEIGRRGSELPAPVARYEFSRLCFKADIIEPLGLLDHFRIDTPDGSFQLSKQEFYAEFQNVVESESYRESRIYHYPQPPQHTTRFLLVEGRSNLTLDQVIDALDRNRQRASYGAVSSLLGRIARSLMQNRAKTPANSWIVSQATGLPTGYSETEMHPNLLARPHVIKSAAELATWLESQSSTGHR